MSGTQNTNPGNFANRYPLPPPTHHFTSTSNTNTTTTSPKDEVREIASKGGQSSHSGGFANMDPDKQVRMQKLPRAYIQRTCHKPHLSCIWY